MEKIWLPWILLGIAAGLLLYQNFVIKDLRNKASHWHLEYLKLVAHTMFREIIKGDENESK